MDGDASFWLVYNATSPGLAGAPERGDSFAVRSPHGRRRLILISTSLDSDCSPRSPRKWQVFCSLPPRGPARPHYVLRMTPLRWGSHEPTNVALVSQFAALKRVPRLAPDRPKEPPEGLKIIKRSKIAPKMSKMGPRHPQYGHRRPLKSGPRQPKRLPSRPKGLQDGPGGPQDDSKTAEKTSKIAPPASLQEAPYGPKTSGGGPEALQR